MAVLAAHRGMDEFMQERTQDFNAISQARRNENLWSTIVAQGGRETLTDHSSTSSHTTAHRPAAGDPHVYTRQILLGDVVEQKGSRRLQPRFPVHDEFRLFHNNTS